MQQPRTEAWDGTPARPALYTRSTDYKDMRGRAIVIDNGSFGIRAGWAKETTPRLVFPSTVARDRTADPTYYLGPALTFCEPSRFNIRTAFDRNLVTHVETQEAVFDHIFDFLGVEGSSVAHPIVMTEPVCNPNYCRRQINELLFEEYLVPSVCYGVDALWSFSGNLPDARDGLVVSVGHGASHVLPVVDGRLDPRCIKRLSLGGLNLADYLARILALRFPGGAISSDHAQEAVEKYLYIPADYGAHLATLQKDPDALREATVALQLPFVPEQVLTKEQIEKRELLRQERTQRLRDIQQRRKLEKLKTAEDELAAMLKVSQLRKTNAKEFRHSLAQHGLQNKGALDKHIGELKGNVRNLRFKAHGDEAVYDDLDEIPGSAPAAAAGGGDGKGATDPFPLLNVPDSDLSGQQLAEKKKQRNLKALQEGRERMRVQREEQRQRKLEEQQRQEAERVAHPERWVESLHAKRVELLGKRKARESERAALADRKSHKSQERMRLIAEAAFQSNQGDDGFGADDDDWRVYRTIAKDESDSEGEGELERIDSLLLQHDPKFAEVVQRTERENHARQHQVWLSVDRCRVPEILFQPALLGRSVAGIPELMDTVFGQLPTSAQDRMARNVFLTGGASQIPGFVERLQAQLVMMRPFQSQPRVVAAKNPMGDAWRGASLFAGEPELLTGAVLTRAEYDEKGGDYLVEHSASNRYYRTPDPPPE